MWQYNYTLNSDEIFHHGIKGQKHGVRNGPPYPLNLTKSSKSSKINADTYLKSSSDFKELRLPIKEYAHVMHEVATHISHEQRNKKVFSKNIGNYAYRFINNFDGTYRIIGKTKIRGVDNG